MLLSQCAKYRSKKSKFIENQKSKGLLSNLGIKTSLSKVLLLGNILFSEYKMNEITNKFLLGGNKFMPGMHLKLPGFTYSACGLFIKKQRKNSKILKKQEIQNIFTKVS